MAIPSDAETRQRTPYDALGGEAGLQRLVDAFYDAMDLDPQSSLRRMHAHDLGPMRARLTDWLVGWTGGPPVYFERHPGRGCIMSAHAPYAIGPAEAQAWMACMRKAFDDVGLEGEIRALLDTAFSRMCEGFSRN